MGRGPGARAGRASPAVPTRARRRRSSRSQLAARAPPAAVAPVLRRLGRRSADQLPGVVTRREPELEVDLRLAAAGLLSRQLAELEQALAAFDRPRAGAQAQVQQA